MTSQTLSRPYILPLLFVSLAPFAFAGLSGCGGGQTDSSAPLNATSATDGGLPPPVDEPIPTLKLPADVHAVREKLDLTIDPNAQTFGGSADLDVTMDTARDGIWIHGLGLNVTKVTISSAAGSNVKAGWEMKDASGVARIVFPKTLQPGALHVHIEYSTKFSPGVNGLYIAKQGGQSYAVTQFEPIDARKAFPCMDEPSAKIPWDVTVTVPKDDQVIANAAEVSRSDKGSNVRVQFAPTAPIRATWWRSWLDHSTS